MNQYCMPFPFSFRGRKKLTEDGDMARMLRFLRSAHQAIYDTSQLYLAPYVIIRCIILHLHRFAYSSENGFESVCDIFYLLFYNNLDVEFTIINKLVFENDYLRELSFIAH